MKKSNWLRSFGGVLFVLFLLDLGWFFASRTYLRSEAFLKLVNTPELRFDAKDGYSPWPGYFIFHSFVFTGLSKDTTYQVKADSIAFHLNPFALLRETVSIRSLTVQDVTIDIGEGNTSVAEAKPKPTQEGAPDDEASASETGKDEKTWVVDFDHAVLQGLKSFRFEDYRFQGNADVRTSFVVDTRQTFRLEETRAKLRGVEVFKKDQRLGRLDTARIFARIESFNLSEKDPKILVPKVDTRWQIKGQLDRMDTIGAYLKGIPWLSLKGSALTVVGDVALRKAAWQDRSHLRFDAKDLKIGLLEQTIDGQGALLWNVREKGSNRLELIFGDYTLNAGRDGEGEGFRLSIDTPDKAAIPKFDDWTSEIILPPTRIHRLQFLQAFIPPSLPLVLEQGKGRLEGRFRAGSGGRNSGGELNLSVNDLSARYKETLTFAGDLSSRIALSRLDLEKGEMDIEDGGIQIRRLDFAEQKGWKGSLHLTGAKLGFKDAPTLSSKVRVEGDNLRPVLAFLVKDKSFPAWIVNAFDLEHPQVNFLIHAEDKALRIQDFRAKAGDLAIEGWYRAHDGDSQARFLMDYAGIAGAYGWRGDESEWKLSGARDWYHDASLNVGR